MKMPSNFFKKEQKSLIEEKYIFFKKIFSVQQRKKKSTDLSPNFPAKTTPKKKKSLEKK